MCAFWAFSWVWIPIVAILAGTFKEWLKFKESQRQLGSSTRELETLVASMKSEIAAAGEREKALVERIQNLEAIVTSEAWDAVHDPALAAPPHAELLDGIRSHLLLTEEEPDVMKAERMARRLRG